MEVISYISVGAVAAFVIAKVVSLITNMFSSPIVQQVVKMAVMIRDSLPPAVINIASGAVMLVKSVLWAIVEVLRGMPPIVVESIKHIILVVAEALHLILHVGYQVAVFLKNTYQVILVVFKSVFVVLRSVNEAFVYVWNFSDNILTPFTNWLLSHPVPSANWHLLVSILLMVVFVSMTTKYLLYKRKLKEN